MIAFLTGGIRRLFQENGKTKEAAALKYGRADRRVLEKRKGRSTDRPEKRINIDALFFLRQAVRDFADSNISGLCCE